LLESGYIEFDIIENKLIIFNSKKEKKYDFNYSWVNRNSLFDDELRHFINCCKNREETIMPVSEGKKSLIISLAMHRSLQTGEVVNI
jgi:hypothetical protein